MKPYLVVTIFCVCLAVSAQAQDQSYTPNARQAIQKSRMQQPQYFELTKDSFEEKQPALQSVSDSESVNFQLERTADIDAPKRRGKKSSESSFAKLAAISRTR